MSDTAQYGRERCQADVFETRQSLWSSGSPQPPPPPDTTAHLRQKAQAASENPAASREFDLRTEVYKLFGVDVTQIPGLEFLALQWFSEMAGICPVGPRRPISFPGWRCARTRTSPGAACCGEAEAGLITERASCFGWPPTRWTAVPLRWELPAE
jgi:hypothetical protein